jgi:hypothetical protein
MKDGSKAAMFMSATLANGKVMTQSGQPTGLVRFRVRRRGIAFQRFQPEFRRGGRIHIPPSFDVI